MFKNFNNSFSPQCKQNQIKKKKIENKSLDDCMGKSCMAFDFIILTISSINALLRRSGRGVSNTNSGYLTD